MISTSNFLNVNNLNFEREVINSKTPVVVEFGANWCGPCHIMAPMIKELADEYNGSIKFCKVDTDENVQLKERLGVVDLPTIILFKSGSVNDFIVGTISKSELKQNLDNLINN
jgi:thioredoxin 1